MENENTKRIAKNTLMLYFRQLLILFVSLYSVRIVLNVLGVEDYGIYSVVGGIVSFFNFLSGTMASATQRFFSFALGKKDQNRLNATFCVNLVIYLIIAFIAITLLETLGLWFVRTKLNVPNYRYDAASFIFHTSVITFIFSIFSSPFMAIIIAHEDMQLYAYVSIIEALLKLSVVFLLKVISLDKLKIYGLLLCIVSAVIALIYILICVKRYSECQFKNFYWDKNQFKETISFTGWTLFGQVTTVARTQAVTILINQVFNPVVVAARTIATQITGHINVFSTNFNTGLYPPIIKAYASDEKKEMFSLIFSGCKITFFLMWIFALPLFIEMDYVLFIWLKNVPEWAVLFTRLALIEALITSISLPIATAARAPGKMKFYELSLGSIQLLIFAFDFLLFKIFAAPAYIVFIVAAIGNLLMLIVRLVNVKFLLDFPIKDFCLQILTRIVIIMFLSSIVSYIINIVLPDTFLFVAFSIFCSLCINFFCMYTVGLTKTEKYLILQRIKGRLSK